MGAGGPPPSPAQGLAAGRPCYAHHVPRPQTRLLLPAVLTVGFALRFREAWLTYLNPDEVLLALSGQSHHLGFTLATADHPPLLGVVLGLISLISSSALALRLPSVAAGALMPWVIYRWLDAEWNTRTATVAMVLLTFAPNLVHLGAQARGYALLMLFCALAISECDRAIRDRSTLRLVSSTVALCLAILTEYSAAWFAGAMGVYAALRMWRQPRGFIAVWVAGQAVAVGLYVWLLHAAPTVDEAQKAAWISGFLRGAFPGPGDRMPAFAVVATLKQFAYLFGSIPLGAAALALFVAGLLVIARRAPASIVEGSVAWTALLVTPFVLGTMGAVLGLHPYGRSRHTVVLSVFIATGIGIALGSVPWPRPRWSILIGAAALVAWWNVAEPDQNNIPSSRALARSMQEAVEFLRQAAPSGAIATDGETAVMLRYYTTGLSPVATTTENGLTMAVMGGLRVGWRQWMFEDAAALEAEVADVRRRSRLAPEDPVWIVDGGFDTQLPSRARARWGPAALRDFRSFDGALVAFRLAEPAAAAVP